MINKCCNTNSKHNNLVDYIQETVNARELQIQQMQQQIQYLQYTIQQLQHQIRVCCCNKKDKEGPCKLKDSCSMKAPNMNCQPCMQPPCQFPSYSYPHHHNQRIYQKNLDHLKN